MAWEKGTSKFGIICPGRKKSNKCSQRSVAKERFQTRVQISNPIDLFY